MANHPSALKRHRQSLKRRARNRAIRSRLRTERKKFYAALDAGDLEGAETQFRLLQKLILRAADHRIVHKNKAARILSRAANVLNQRRAG